jgi:hypothetical protein
MVAYEFVWHPQLSANFLQFLATHKVDLKLWKVSELVSDASYSLFIVNLKNLKCVGVYLKKGAYAVLQYWCSYAAYNFLYFNDLCYNHFHPNAYICISMILYFNSIFQHCTRVQLFKVKCVQGKSNFFVLFYMYTWSDYIILYSYIHECYYTVSYTQVRQ